MDLESGKLYSHGNYFLFFLLILLYCLNVTESLQYVKMVMMTERELNQVKLSRIVIDKACLLILLCC